MTINVLRDYCSYLTDADADALMSCWGVWALTAQDRLGYTKPKYGLNITNSTKCVWLNDEELEIIDKAMAILRGRNSYFFKALRCRFVYGLSLRGIAKQMQLESTNKVYGLLNNGRAEFKNIIKGLVKR